MGGQQTDLSRVLDALAGREPWPAKVDPEFRARAERLIERGRAVHAESPAPKSALRKANRIFRNAMKKSADRPALLRLVFDSWFEPAPALRRAGPDSTRFFRYDGTCKLELQARETPHGVDLFGQIDPPDAASEVRVEIEGKQRRAAVDSAGSFRFARLPHGAARLVVGDSTIEGVPL